MSMRRRIERLEAETPDPDARGPQFPVLWGEDEEAPANLPPGSRVARVIWGGPEKEEGGPGATSAGGPTP